MIEDTSYRHGFTLVELLVVISIITFIASVVLASVNQSRIKARDARRISDVREIRVALELYLDVNKTYPLASSSCVSGGAAYGLELLAPIYIRTVPRDPDGTCYKYATLTISGPQTTYHVGASLEDTNHQVLASSDKDCNSSAGAGNNCPVQAVYGGAGIGFNGIDSTTGCAGVTGRACYDITP